MLVCDFCIYILIFIAVHTPLAGGIGTFNYYNHLATRLVHGKVFDDLAECAAYGLLMEFGDLP